MKKIVAVFIVLLSLFVFAACSEKDASEEKKEVIQINDDVDEELANDTLEVLKIIESSVKGKKKPKLTDEQKEKLQKYPEKYAEEKHHRQFQTMYDDEPDFTVSDYQIFMRTETLVLAFGPNALLEDDGSYVNNSSSVQRDIDDIVEMIENGFQKKK